MEDTQKLKYKAKLIDGKLMLTSTDIQVGDEIIDSLTGNKFIWKAILPYKRETDFKVIGEISPEATWVKEGDEFGEDQVFPVHTHDWDTGAIIYLNHDDEVVDMPVYNIQGPCGHFH